MPSTPKQNTEQAGPIVISSKRLGDLAEQWVGMLAAWKGAEVFPNGNSTGSTDLVIRVNGQIYQLDVKVSTWRDGRWDAKNTHLVKAPVIPCVVEPIGDIASWRVRWLRRAVPKGLENFWDKDYRTVTTKPNEVSKASD